MAILIQAVILVFSLSFFFSLLNKLPSDIGRVVEARSSEQARDFWSELLVFLGLWVLCLGVLGVFVIPFLWSLLHPILDAL